MASDPSERFQTEIEFRGSAWYPGLISLLTSTGGTNVTETPFSLPDLVVLRDKIDLLIEREGG